MSDPTSPPPPPYEPLQQEFDQKTSHALEASLSITADVRPHLDNPLEIDIWEDYNEEAFEAAFRAAEKQRQLDSQAITTGTSNTGPIIQSFGIEKVDRSTTPSVQPLRIHKKAPSNSHSRSKERLSWYEEAQLGESSSVQAVPNPSSSHHGEVRNSHSTPPRQSFISEHDEEDVAAPPPFESVGPNLEGPPFEEEDRQQHRRQHVAMTYHSNESAPPSPLSSPQVMHSPLPSPSPPFSHIPPPSSTQPERMLPSRPPQSITHNHHQSLPSSRRPPRRMGPRPTTGYMPTTKAMFQTRPSFNPSVAYSKPDNSTHSRMQDPISVNAAAAFYNSAVSSHLSATSSKPAPRVSQPYLSPTDDQQSQYFSQQYFSQQSSFQPGGLIYRAPSPVRPLSQSSSYMPQQPPTQMPSSGVDQLQSYRQRPASRGGDGDSQMRWATSEYQILREF